MSRSDTISGGQFFAALRLVVHFESGKEVDQGLAFAQGMYRGRRYETFLIVILCKSYPLPSAGHLSSAKPPADTLSRFPPSAPPTPQTFDHRKLTRTIRNL
jgi:hypothetical protein